MQHLPCDLARSVIECYDAGCVFDGERQRCFEVNSMQPCSTYESITEVILNRFFSNFFFIIDDSSLMMRVLYYC